MGNELCILKFEPNIVLFTKHVFHKIQENLVQTLEKNSIFEKPKMAAKMASTSYKDCFISTYLWFKTWLLA